MREKDLEQQLAEIECRRLQGKLSHEEAVLARQNVIQENKKKADLMREEVMEVIEWLRHGFPIDTEAIMITRYRI